MASNWSLRTHVAILAATLVVAVTAVMGGVASERSLDRLASSSGAALALRAQALGERLESDMQGRANSVAALSTLPVLLTPAEGRRVAEAMKAAEPALAWFGVIDPQGRVVAATDGVLEGRNLSGRPVFREGIRGEFLGDVHEAVLLSSLLGPRLRSDEPLRFVDVARPIVDQHGAILGVAAAHFSWDWASSLALEAAQSDRDAQGLEMLVLGADGTVLIGPNAFTGRKVASAALRLAGPGAKPGYVVETWDDDGKTYLVGHARRGPFGWTVLARQPVEVAFEPSERLRRDILMSGIWLAVIFSLIGWLAAGYLSRPLRRIAEAADRLRAGKVGGRIPRLAGSSEVASLSSSLADMVDKLTSRDAAIADLSDLAGRDGLTGLANRRAFEDQLKEIELDLDGGATLLYVDLDDFKPVNDIHGHAAGDEVLRAVAARLEAVLKPGDMAARLGGDEFAIVFRPALPAEDAHTVAQKLVAAVAAPVRCDGVLASVGCCVGAASWPEDAPTLRATLEAADRALYRAKRAGKMTYRLADLEA